MRRLSTTLVPLVGLTLVLLAPRVATPTETGDELGRINEGLRHWLRLMDADRLYLVVDGSAGEVRLQHGTAVLRQCRIVGQVDATGTTVDLAQSLTARLRRYRRTDPFTDIGPGPFDWEQYLVDAATDAAALLFSGDLLLYAEASWQPARDPSLQLEAADLRALHDALDEGTELVVLPAGWEKDDE